MMTDLLERTRTPYVEQPRPSDVVRPLRVPADIRPPERPPTTQPSTSAPWPPRARLTIVILAIVALLAGVAAVVGFATRDGSTDADLEQSVATLTAERNELTEQLGTVTAERDALDAEITTVQDDLDATIATLADEGEQLRVTVDAQEGTIDDLDATIATLTDEGASLRAERDALLALFPIAVDTELDPDVVPGTYDADLTQVYCTGFTACGTLPVPDELTIRTTADDGLELVVPGYPVAGMAELDGVLYAVMDVTFDDGGVTRVARTTVSIFAHDVTVADDGTQTITDFGASVTMHSRATATTVAGTAVHAMQLTPQS